jgi:D-3-phosphoglycerate dehydrogenase
MKGKVLVTAFVHPHLCNELRQMGYEIDVNELISYEELLNVIEDYTGIIISTRLSIDSAQFDQATQLKWLARLGSGMEIVDVTYAAQKGIQCFSSPEGNCDAVAEWCLGTLIALRRNLFQAAAQVKNLQWIREPNRGPELQGKTIGIIGYGHTGSAFARLLGSFGVKVLAHDKYKTGFGSGHVLESDCEAIAANADVVSLHLPLGAETHHYVDDAFFQRLRQKPFLLNSSRGSVVDAAALRKALDSGMIAGAGIDVLENESLATYTAEEWVQLNGLSHRPNVIITPHIAGYSQESLFKMADTLIRKLKAAGY